MSSSGRSSAFSRLGDRASSGDNRRNPRGGRGGRGGGVRPGGGGWHKVTVSCVFLRRESGQREGGEV